jgi:phosphoribosyl 1,2-cyclic phosphate phosphodiesterase
MVHYLDRNDLVTCDLKRLIFYFMGSKVLVLNALQKDPHISHFTLDEAVSLAQELEIEQTYFTHISHRLGLHKEINQDLPDNIELAWDGQKIEL